MKLFKLLCTLTPVAALVSCASTSNEVPRLSEVLSSTVEQDGRACVRTNTISGYGVRDGEVIMIDAMADYYIATVHPGCTALDTSMTIAFSGSFNEICGRRADKILTGEDSCTINQIFRFEDREEAFAAYDSAVAKRQSMRESK